MEKICLQRVKDLNCFADGNFRKDSEGSTLHNKLKNCKKCGVVFFSQHKDICNDCAALELKQINEICAVVEKHVGGSITVSEICSATGISEKEVEYYIKKSRLYRVINKIALNCKVCGALITNIKEKGFLCDECIKEMGRDPSQRTAVNTDPVKKVALKNFDKDIMHSVKDVDVKKEKYSFKKNYD